jgi:hypothetical protein
MPYLEPTVREALEPFEVFSEGFSLSRKGNLWRMWNGKTLTVFPDGAGRWTRCIADSKGHRFSPRRYSDREMALSTLLGEVGGLMS